MVETAQETQGYYQGVGKRKTAIASVRLSPNDDKIVVNGKTVEQYFPRVALQIAVVRPLQVTEMTGKFGVSVKVLGGGVAGQAAAVAHGIARALVVNNEELRPVLRHAGLLTRDSRVKERKKYGLKRARKAPQYTKR